MSIRRRVRPELGGIALGAICLAATNALALSIPWLIKGAIDALRAGAPAHPGGVQGLVVRNAGLIAACAVTQALIRTWSRILIFNAGRNIEYRLRGDVFRHLLRQDAGFFREHPTGDVMSRLTNDLSAVRMLFAQDQLDQVRRQVQMANQAVVIADVEGQIDEQVRTAFFNLKSSSDLVNVARSSIDLASQTLGQAQDRFRAGVADNLEVVQAQESVAAAEQDYIASLYAHNLAKATLARSLGQADQNIKQFLGKQ